MSNQDVTTHKFVAVLNKKAELGKVVNALAHMSVGLGASAIPEEKELMGFIDYIDKDGNHHNNLSKNSYVILRADNSNQIRTARKAALEKGIRVVDFTSTMQEGTYIDQINRTKEIPEAELEYYGICMFGPIAEISELTRKFQLWKI
ncbi:MAG: hypothetical protein UU82_C0042G0008 [Candidatus Nomurabacteria bacterium GW2011_GWC2_41_8]|uniref:DUF2000 domain-containing protein n=3 Tax=Candidatus Nomuraibacteriota TaxID=1752729 RepID=A0A1F6YCB9_9BACT|nr:MAG: hypothetical protein UU58_C0014G0008 [Candidatus Nomurabacteria bacterium GW2011_GWA2_41_25]KKS23047.1 MAG: hypothetical protein UU82_C0042G0008 [Candidatus Nomurabacteria bacterium GW2011_GWC2_41_8]OGI67569.1 MAG: hypothetical protein A2823_02985 [Candidatus Nomurabacteria bacterium RIFCSPHIGHO2_01_FULL_41_91]OGI80199.1 MAG: hypothetical protein A3D43_03220 [Candidatus Nomurabacteria bacterium RIFCSPHIGHO2_02_FULL_41_52]OGI85263.1 MAG: hypothetical protein A3F49_01080 [Candidatus Nomur